MTQPAPLRGLPMIFRHMTLLACVALAPAGWAGAQTDPGPRPGPAGAGGPIKGLSEKDEKLFWASWERYKKLYSVSGTIEAGAGLGPGFNGTGCAQCHAQPAAGGSSPSPHSPQVRQVSIGSNKYPALVPQSNPQVALASLDRLPGKNQKVPPFISEDGPVRVPRFVRNADGTPDGSTHDIYTIAGRKDAPDCTVPQPDFEAQITAHNIVYRIPSPTFGAGLIESVPDSALESNLDSTAGRREALGISGRFNRSANDGTISRFGWKAQNKSLMIFAAESYNVEMGVTSETFPDKRIQAPGCTPNPLPEDRTRVEIASNALYPGGALYPPSELASDVVNFASFMRLSAAPIAATHTTSELSGKAVFEQIGCSACHSPRLTTGRSTFTGMSEITIEPYSDFALHHMGPGLADGISQGLAGSDEFRTAPLWGLGQRIFFLHDGRTDDLMAAIRGHSSKGTPCKAQRPASTGSGNCRSEADAVISQFDSLSKEQQQDLLNFLRSL
jgi:CxxC motif-containing protein (DUF1111 family)